MSKVVKLQASDGHELDAYVAQPDGKPWGGLVVIQEIFGVNQHIRSVADRFAQEGFYAVAPALFDRVQRNLELTDAGEDMQKGMAAAQKINIDDAVKDVDAALQYAAKETGKPAGVVGYCYGGTLAWLSATRLGAGRRGGLLRWPHRQVRRRETARSCHAPLREARQPHPPGRCGEGPGGSSGGGDLLV